MSLAGAAQLAQGVRLRVLARYGGNLCTGLGLLALAPVACALLVGEPEKAGPYAGLAAGLLAAGLVLGRVRAPTDVQPGEGLIVPALVFVLAPPVFALPAMAEGVAPLDALFESVSGITTTGLSTLGSVETHSRTFLFTRAWLQWIGGLGVVVLALVLFSVPGSAARRLGPEGTGHADLVGSTRARARRVLVTYAVLTLLGVGLLCAQGLSLFESLVHTLASVSTGGFSSHDRSLAAFDSWLLRASVIAISTLGAISFGLYWLPRRALGLLRDPEVRVLLGAGLAGAGALCLLALVSDPQSFAARLPELPLLAFSAQTTTGFSSLDPVALDAGSKLVLIAAMASGGDVGSTAGGVKLLRVLILVRVLQVAIRRRLVPPHAVLAVRLRGQRLEEGETVAALALILLFGIVAVVSWLPFLVLGYDPLNALFEVVSALGTVGLSTGLVRPELEPLLKVVLCLDMWFGRLEIIPFLILFHPRAWLRAGRRSE